MEGEGENVWDRHVDCREDMSPAFGLVVGSSVGKFWRKQDAVAPGGWLVSLDNSENSLLEFDSSFNRHSGM